MSLSLTLRQLEYLVAVADRRSFHRAASACHVSQPGLSAQIKQLEHVLGVSLFERDRRHVFVTPAGEALAARARRILTDSSELVDAARTFTRPLAGPLRLGVIPTIAPYLLPAALPIVRERHPELELRLIEDQTDRLLARLDNGGLDVLLLALDAPLGDVATLALFDDPFWLAAPADHPLCRRKAVRERDLDGESVLLLEDGHCLRDQALSFCSRAGANELGDFRATSLTTLAQMVASGVGVTLLPEMAIDREARAGAEIEVRPFRKPKPHRTVGLAWRRTSARADEFALLAESFR